MTIARKELNTELNGIEIYFNVFPIDGTRETLKKNGFKWNHKKGCWYAKYTSERNTIADTCVDISIDEYRDIARECNEEIKEIHPRKATERKATPKRNKFNVKVGDFFVMSWGYEQTNVDYFQVIELVGSCSVRIREVNPPIISADPTCSMAEDRIYDLDTSKLLPPTPYSVHINDNEKGDLKRLKSYAQDGVSNPQITMASYADAHYVSTRTDKQYVSWYY